MGKEDVDRECMEFECNDLSRRFVDEAVKNAINAFNEGYILGRRHAEMVFGQEDDNENKG